MCGRCLEVCSARSIRAGELIIDRSRCTACGKCVAACLNDANEILGREETAEQVFAEVIKDKVFYDSTGGGITVTGGEPSFQPEFTLELLRLSKDAGITLSIETCGIGARDFYEKAAALGCTFLFDIKCMEPHRHRELTGADNAHILSNLRYLMDEGADVIIRLPMIPGCNDSDSDIENLCRFLNENKGRYRYAEIMPYHSLGIGKAEKLGAKVRFARNSAEDAEIERWCSLFASHGTEVKVSK